MEKNLFMYEYRYRVRRYGGLVMLERFNSHSRNGSCRDERSFSLSPIKICAHLAVVVVAGRVEEVGGDVLGEGHDVLDVETATVKLRISSERSHSSSTATTRRTWPPVRGRWADSGR